VLPFANLSADKENEYFSDGLAEDIIDALTQVPGLRVMARTSAFAFRGKEQDVRKIGAELNVENIFEGSVRRAGNRIRVTVQLGKRRVPSVEPALRPGDDRRIRHTGRNLASDRGEAAGAACHQGSAAVRGGIRPICSLFHPAWPEAATKYQDSRRPRAISFQPSAVSF